MSHKTFPPEVDSWLKETLSRRKPPTVAQLDVIKPLFRRASQGASHGTSARITSAA